MTDNKEIYNAIVSALADLSNTKNKESLQQFFKTKEGEYGAGDVFIGVKVPEQRQVAKAFFKEASLATIQTLLESKIHEHRLTAIFILTLQFAKCKNLKDQKTIVDFYLANRAHVNNWDIVDSSTHKILGPYIEQTKEFDILERLADEDNLWSKRIAVVAFWHLFKKGFIKEGLAIISKNLNHSHDLMHKANGWMLRELAAFDETAMLQYLENNYSILPRTTLRYAMEKLDKDQRLAILKDGNFM